MRVLDLYCGAGGAAMGYSNAGFEVVGVDIYPQPNYPFEFVQANALGFLREYDLSEFDLIHASPPCQGYSTLQARSRKEYPKLIAPTRELCADSGIPFVIENVSNARSSMIDPITLCGSMFNLRVRRHRLFEASFPITPPECQHAEQEAEKPFIVYEHGKWRRSAIALVYGTGSRKAKEYWPYAMGMGETWDDCWMTPLEMVEAIPPAYTEYIGKEFNERIARQT